MRSLYKQTNKIQPIHTHKQTQMWYKQKQKRHEPTNNHEHDINKQIPILTNYILKREHDVSPYASLPYATNLHLHVPCQPYTLKVNHTRTHFFAFYGATSTNTSTQPAINTPELSLAMPYSVI